MKGVPDDVMCVHTVTRICVRSGYKRNVLLVPKSAGGGGKHECQITW